MGGQTCLSRHVLETPFYASFSVKKPLGTQRHQQAVGSSHFGPAVFYKQLLQFMLETKFKWFLKETVPQNYKMNSGILFDTLGDKV